MVGLADLRNCADALNPVVCLLHGLSVIRGDVHNALAVNLIDRDDSTCLGLDLLDGLATLSDDSADEVLVDLEGLDPRNERLVVLTRLVDALHHLAHDVHSALMSLLESLGENLVGKTVNLDVHLCGGDAVLCTGHLEVHISEVILVTENVGENGIAAVRILLIGDKTHRHTGYRLADLDAGVHECKAATADRSL